MSDHDVIAAFDRPSRRRTATTLARLHAALAARADARGPPRRRLPHRRQPARPAAARRHAGGARARRVRRRGPRRRARRAGGRRSARASCGAGRASTTSPASSTSTSPARRRTFDVAVDLRLAHGFRRDVLEHLRRDPLRHDRELRRRRPGPTGRPRAVRAVGTRVRAQPGARRRAVPPRRAQRRLDRPVPRRRRGQADAARAGGGVTPRRASSTGRAITAALDELGCAVAGPVLDGRPACRALADLYDDDDRFRSTVDMARHRFGAGRVPLLRPPAAGARRPSCGAAFWPHLLPIARDWAERGRAPGAVARRASTTGSPCATTPARAARRRCCCATAPGTGTRCTATSTATSCSRCRSSSASTSPGDDYTGGEFVVVEQRPRAQSRATSDADRPRRGARVHDARPARALDARLGRGADAPRRQRRARRPAPHARPASSTTRQR